MEWSLDYVRQYVHSGSVQSRCIQQDLHRGGFHTRDRNASPAAWARRIENKLPRRVARLTARHRCGFAEAALKILQKLEKPVRALDEKYTHNQYDRLRIFATVLTPKVSHWQLSLTAQSQQCRARIGPQIKSRAVGATGYCVVAARFDLYLVLVCRSVSTI